MVNLGAGLAVLFISFWAESRLPIPRGAAKILGLIVTYGGMALVLWAALHIKGGITGAVRPRLNTLLKDGPYRFVRHPVYLGLSVALAGVALALRSWGGLLGVLLLFVPSSLYRAKLEERALAQKFGAEWQSYARQTNFFIPVPGKQSP